MNYDPDQKMSLSQPKSPHRHWSHYLLPSFFLFPCLEVSRDLRAPERVALFGFEV